MARTSSKSSGPSVGLVLGGIAGLGALGLGAWALMRKPAVADTPATVQLQPRTATNTSWHDTVVRLQLQLNAFGFGPLPVTGVLDQTTSNALQAFLRTHPLPPGAPTAPGTIINAQRQAVDNGYWYFAWVTVDNAARAARGFAPIPA